MAGLGGALAGLSAMYGGYKQGEMDEFKIDDAKRGELAKVAMGNALKMLGAGPQGQGGGGLPQMGGQPPGMPPGQPSQPMQQPSPVGGQGLPGPGGMPPRPGMGMPSGGPSQGPGGMPQMGGPPRCLHQELADPEACLAVRRPVWGVRLHKACSSPVAGSSTGASSCRQCSSRTRTSNRTCWRKPSTSSCR